MARRLVYRLIPLACLAGPPSIVSANPTPAALLQDFLAAADRGHCVEMVTYRMIRELGPANAAAVVQAALAAHARRDRQQRGLGCDGDIAAQAIAAGADPEQVLKATAAGL